MRNSTKKENVRKHRTEILDLKNTMTIMKNSIDSFNSELEEAKGKISKLQHRSSSRSKENSEKE